jgi:hypothetical protein
VKGLDRFKQTSDSVLVSQVKDSREKGPWGPFYRPGQTSTSLVELSERGGPERRDCKRLLFATLAKYDLFGTPSTSHWTGAATIVQSPRKKTCIVTRSRTSTRPMPFSLAE